MQNCEKCKAEKIIRATENNTVPFVVLEAEREHHRREKRNIVIAFLIVLLALIGYIAFDRYQDSFIETNEQIVDQRAQDNGSNNFIGGDMFDKTNN